jgi:hypothetical protein
MVDMSLVVRYSPSTQELAISASRAALAWVAGLVEAGAGEVAADGLADAAPYEVCLTRLRIRTVPAGGVVLSVSAEAREVLVEGEAEGLRVLGENLRALAAEADYGDHLHIEYFPEHFYLDESSVPAVVQLIPSDELS